jgi:intracellular proteinase inhibitor BsuPI
VTVAGQDSLRLELLLEPRVRAGEPVRFRLRVQNVAQRPLDLYLRGRTITFDVLISRAVGGVVWRRLEGEIIPAIVQLRPLAPGERLEAEAVWDQRANDGKRVEPGEYVVDASLLVEGEPLRTPQRSLTILGPAP